MANSDKNLIITPNIGSSTDDPKIVFSGANSSVSAQNITARVYPTSNGTLSFEGTSGQLFSITNSFTGTIFSVNDVSGIPSIQVQDTGLISMAPYSGNVSIGSTSDQGYRLYVGGSLSASSFTGAGTGLTGTASSLSVGYATSAGSATNATTASTANSLNTSNNYQVNSLGVGTSSTTTGQIKATTAIITPGTNGVSTGLNVVNGDITTYRSGGTTGVIYLSNSGGNYLYWNGSNYYLGGNIALDSSNYTSYSPTLTGSGASGTWGINVTGYSTQVNLGNSTSTQILANAWAGTGGYSGYQFTGGNSRFGFSSTGGVIDVYADGNFYATDSSYLVLHTGNYTSYAPSLTGSGASGTWGINVTGSAGSATNASNLTGGNITGNMIVNNATSPNSYYLQFGDNTGWIYRFMTNASGTPTTRFSFVDNGTLIVVGSVQAPVFYDSNDSSYYVDPNSSSNLYAAYLNVNQYGSSGNWNQDFYNAPAGTFRYAGDVGAITTNNPGGTWWFQTNYRHTNSSNYWGTQVAWGWEDNANKLAQRNISGGGWSSWVYYLNSGNYTNYNSYPIIYDSDNSGYYLDLSSTSNSAMRIRGGTLFGPNPTWGAYLYVGTNGNIDSSTATVATTNGNLHLDAANGYVMYLNNYATSSYTVAAQSMRSPVFYDYNDTAYYVDPNGTSVFNDGNMQLYKSQTVDMSDTGVYSTSNYYPVIISVPYSGAWIEIQNNLNSNAPSWATHPNGFTLNLKWWTNGSGWGTTEVKRRVEQYHEGWTNSTICGGITQMTNSSIEVVWLRGGGSYYFKFSRNLTASAQSSTYTSNSQSVSPTSSAQNGVWDSYSGAHYSYNASVYADTRIEAPVFYDRNDTGYYIDPNSTTNLYALTVNQTISGSVSGSAGSATNATYATSAGSANNATYAGNSGTLGGLSQYQLFNNMGNNHGVYNNFSDVPNFGTWFVHQDSYTDGPSAIGVGLGSTGQYYTRTQGLGNDYGYSSYAFEEAIGRSTSQPYHWVRSKEGGTWQGWTKVAAGYADSAGSANGVNQYPNRTDSAWYQINWNNAANSDKNLYSSGNILLRSSGYGAIGWNGSAWYIEGNATYGLYSNTGFYANGGLWDAGNRVYSAGNPQTNISGNAGSATNATYATTAGGIATSTNLQVNSLGVNTAGSGTAGEIRATNNITAYYSDDRLKTKLGNISNALTKIKSLSGFYYEANEIAQSLGYTVQKEIGVSAQEVQAILPEIVVPAPIDENYLTVRYEKLIPLLIEAIKEQQDIIDSQEQRLAKLESLLLK